jgi:nucleoside-diphosphate-sugar epimerase
MTPLALQLAGPDFADQPATTVVTGASGWLGQSLVETLATEPGRQLRCLVRGADQIDIVRKRAPDAKVVVGDVRDPSALDRLFEGLDRPSVFHTAALIHPESGRTRDFFDCNVGGTSLVADRARRVSACRLVHVSSNSPFGFNHTPYEVFDEDSDYHPVGGYGRSKLEAERRVLDMASRGDLAAVVIRAPWFYGPNQPARQTKFFSAIRKGRFPRVGDGSNRRSMVYVDNLVQGLLRAERRQGVEGSSLWVADAEPYTMSRVMDAVKAALADNGLPVAGRQLRLPGGVGDLAEWLDTGLQGLGRYSQALHVLSELNKTIACSIDGAARVLGYQPTVALEEGMKRSVAWCLEQGMEL